MDLLDHIVEYLKQQGIARKPFESAPSAPPIWPEPDLGTPAPGEGNNATEKGTDAVIGMYSLDQVTPKPGEGYAERNIIEFRLRTTNDARARQIARQLYDAFTSQPVGPKVDWDMAGLHLNESHQRIGFQRVGSDRNSFTFRIGFLFEVPL